MEFRRLGKTDLLLSRVGIGTWEISGDVWGRKDDAVSVDAILAGIESGANFIDTAAGYGKGHAEHLVSVALTKLSAVQASSIVVSTKILPKNGVFAPAPHISIKEAYPREWIIAQVEASLGRLGRDRIDILFLHTWNRAWANETEWLEALNHLKSSGKIRSFGISIPDEGIADANVAIALEQIDAVQCVFNIFQQEPAHTIFPLARKHQVGVVARSPFSSGVLAQQWTPDMKFEEGDWRASWPLTVKPDWLKNQIRMASIVNETLEENSTSRVAASLAFILDNDDVTSVIPGSANPNHVRQNVSSINNPRILPELREKLRRLWAANEIHGTYNGSI